MTMNEPANMAVNSATSKAEVYARLRSILIEMFEVEAADINPEANMYEDLDIDSIDAVDLIVQLKDMTGRKVDPEVFKQIRTVQDVVDAVADLMK